MRPVEISPMNYGNRSTVERSDKVRNEKHRKWIRKHLCILWNWHDVHECQGPVECCHVKTGNGATNRSKASDEKTLPMCRKLHDEQTRMGEAQFERKYGIDMNAYADAYAAKSPYLRNASVVPPTANATDAGAVSAAPITCGPADAAPTFQMQEK